MGGREHIKEMGGGSAHDSDIFPPSEIHRLFQEPCFIGNKDFALILNIGHLGICNRYSFSDMVLFMINGC